EPRRLIIRHCHSAQLSHYHSAIAEQSAYVQFDTIRGDNAYDTEKRVEYVLSLIRQGHLEQILLSHDVCIRSHLRTFGGPGYTYVPTGFADELRSRGLTADDIQQLLVENPRRALTGLD